MATVADGDSAAKVPKEAKAPKEAKKAKEAKEAKPAAAAAGSAKTESRSKTAKSDSTADKETPAAAAEAGDQQTQRRDRRQRGDQAFGASAASGASGAGAASLQAREPFLRRVLHIRKVARVNSGGKVRSVSALVVVGNQNGSAGYGMGRAEDGSSAIQKATAQAEKNMVFFDRLENRTIFSDIDHQFHHVRLKLFSARPGYGLVVNNYVHEVARCIGISDLGGKVHGSKNPMNVIKAAFEAFSSQKRPSDIAKIRGKKVVDVEMAYYGTKL
ncbi:ribosomal protein S5, C-terminal domain-containing protein [Entophlyctis helioformis]|nr:ribosomal protein S5, C-terminal domain-containing protein [Entophlyctis helioformis]